MSFEIIRITFAILSEISRKKRVFKYCFHQPFCQRNKEREIEKHAYETYVKYGAYHPEDKKIQEIANDELEHSKELHKAMLMIA